DDIPMRYVALVNECYLRVYSLPITSVTATNGTAVLVGGTNVLFTPAADFNGTGTIGYRISDGNGGTASALITVAVGAANDPPVAVDDNASTAEDVPVTISPLDNDSDVDGERLTIRIVNATIGTEVIMGVF